MGTLATIRAQTLLTIREASDNSNFTTAQLNDLINQSLLQIAPKIHYPRKEDSGTQVTAGTADYDAASDFVSLISAYFGDNTVENDKLPLTVVNEETLKYIRPTWLVRTTASRGRPTRILLMDRNTFRLDPVPDATNAASGKKLWLYYVYTPAALSADGDTPDVPTIYHDAIQFYAAHLAYLSLQNAEVSGFMLGKFDKMVKELQPTIERDASELMRFQWGFKEF